MSYRLHVAGYPDTNPRVVFWATEYGLDPLRALEQRREDPERAPMFTLWISREWRAYDQRHGIAPYRGYWESDHERFDREQAARLGLELVGS